MEGLCTGEEARGFLYGDYVLCLIHFPILSLDDKEKQNHICLTSLTRAKCGVRSTLCWKNPNISGSIKLFAL